MRFQFVTEILHLMKRLLELFNKCFNICERDFLSDLVKSLVWEIIARLAFVSLWDIRLISLRR